MRGFGFQVIMPMIMGALGLSLFLVMDFYTRSQAEPDGLTVSEYAMDLPRRAMVALRDSQTTRTLTIEDYLPKAPEGWTARELRDSDRTDLTGIAPVERELTEMEKELAENVMFQVVAAQQTRGFKGTGQFYASPTGDHILTLDFTPARVFNGIGGAQMGMMVDFMDIHLDKHPFAVVEGVEFEIMPLEDAPHVREVTGRIGRQVTISLLTDDSDVAAMALLQQLDMEGLNNLLAEPVEGVGRGRETRSLISEAVQERGPVALQDDASLTTEQASFFQNMGFAPPAAPEPEMGIDASDMAAGAPAGGGFLGRLFGGGGDGPPVEAEPALPDLAAVEIPTPPAKQNQAPVIRRGAQGSGGFTANCQRNRGVKTCTVGND